MNMKLPIYDLIINQDENNDAEVSFVALVDSPAIKKEFLSFNEEFIDPNKGEQKDEFLPRCISYVINEGKDNEQAVAICNSLWEQHFAACPIATQDIKVNLKNRENAITVGNYGPANPSLPNNQYWVDKGKIFGGTPEEAKTMTCNNCAAFNRSKEVLDCIAQGLGNEADPLDTIKAGDLGYCEIFDFKCASSRTCDAWVANSFKKKKKKEEYFAEDSYTDYPKQASENAKAALRYAEEYGWKECGTPVGKARANQLANNEPISRDTIARMASFERHRENSNKELGDGCGRLMWLAWGGDAGVEWAARKLKQIDNTKLAFAIQSESEHIITGPLMIPQQLIYRNSEQFGEHYVKFSVETIKQIAIKFSKKGYQKNVNLMHEADMKVDGLTMFESFISDSKRGIKPMEAFKDLPDGTWFGSFYVENPKVWQMVKEGQVKGFSVEGMFDYEEPVSEDKKQLEKLREILNSF
jgi:hypothetical protein